MPRILPVNPSTIAEVANVLQHGGVAVFPTETVYGLGACTLNEHAIAQVFTLKGRPADNPLIAHVHDAAQAREIIAHGAWDDRCAALAARFWPGPLTLVLPKSKRVGDRATAGRPTIAVRSPQHVVARSLLAAVGQPISAPSANRSGRISPTTAQHVLEEFVDVPGADTLLILDGGACEVGIESTVLDLSTPPPASPRILRHGSVTLEQLEQAIGPVEAPVMTAQAASPGTRSAHYAPQTQLALVTPEQLPAVIASHDTAGHCCAVLADSAVAATITPPHVALIMPNDPARYARELYARLREADALNMHRILIVLPDDQTHLWRAVHDRLARAAAGSPAADTP